jgi:hypothetical protein
MLVAFTFEVSDGEFIITAITPIKKHVMNNKNQAIRE